MENQKPILIMMVGLPRSGKSTFALYDMANAPIVSPDAIRYAIHGHRFIAEAEPYVWLTAKTMVRSLFLAGHPQVVLDATNITRPRRDMWRDDMWERKFIHIATPASVCLERAEWECDKEIIPVIEKMHLEHQPVDEDEEGECLVFLPDGRGGWTEVERGNS